MLTSLSIKNFALIEKLSIEFENGFTTITGETGAGKSILLGALGLVLGKRADGSSLKNKEEKCVIEAQFSISKYNLQSFFEIHDFTQTNGQGPDIGTQYLSAIFYCDENQKNIAEELIEQLKKKAYKVATTLRPKVKFYKAESYHQNYYNKSGKTPYCHSYRKVF